MKFQLRLRALKGDMSEAALAEAAGLPYATVHNYILGRRAPSYGAVVKLAKALGTDCRAFSACEDLLEADGRASPRRRTIKKARRAAEAPKSPAEPATKVRRPKRKEK